MLEPIHIAALHHQYSVLDSCYTLHTTAISNVPSTYIRFPIPLFYYIYLLCLPQDRVYIICHIIW